MSFIIHITSRHTLSEPAHSFVHLPPDVTLAIAAKVAKVLSVFPSVYRTSIRVDDVQRTPFHEFPGIYVKGQYRHWQREGRV